MKKPLLFFFFVLLVLNACNNKENSDSSSTQDTTAAIPNRSKFEGISLLGDTLYPLQLDQKQQYLYDSALLVAANNYKSDPKNLDNIIWYGRRLAYLSQYQEAISIFTEGIKTFPNSPELYRHRGHRYITLRKFDQAIADLEKAAKLVEGKPVQKEKNGIPLPSPSPNESSLQFNIWYHLGLAYFLEGEYGKAAKAYETCLEYSKDDDSIVATANWLYLTYRRLGEDEVAERTLAMINFDMDIKENDDYFKNLLVYKGAISPDSLINLDNNQVNLEGNLQSSTQGYGMGSYYYLDIGDPEMGKKIYYQVIDGGYWPSFGYIAAEADLARENNTDSIDF